MSKYRRAAKIDANQPKIIEELLSFPGMSVETDKDDLIVGYKGVSLWVEVKNESCYSKKTGELLESGKRDSQKRLDKTYTGARIYAKCSGEIFDWFGVTLS